MVLLGAVPHVFKHAMLCVQAGAAPGVTAVHGANAVRPVVMDSEGLAVVRSCTSLPPVTLLIILISMW